MKVYTEVIIKIETGDVISRKGYDYNGPVAHLKGGGSTVTNIDEAYNARMAAIAEAQQKMAEEYFTFWRSQYKPYEAEMLQANRGLIPQETGLRQAQLQGAIETAPMQAAAQKAMFGGAPAAINEFYRNSNVDISQRMDQAEADAAQGFDKSQGQLRRGLSRMGIMPGSERFLSMQQDFALDRARGIGGARTMARRQADEDRYNRSRYAAMLVVK